MYRNSLCIPPNNHTKTSLEEENEILEEIKFLKNFLYSVFRDVTQKKKQNSYAIKKTYNNICFSSIPFFIGLQVAFAKYEYTNDK